MITPRRSTRIFLSGGAALALGIAGLQSGAAVHAATARPLTVKVALRDFRVIVSRHRLPVATPIRFIITNQGKAMHELVLERAGADDDALKVGGKEYEADDIAPGTTRTVTWIVPHAGKYQLACHEPGHFEMGMKTTVTVSRSA
jgi:uncharacterized cupredoxin-like copper-binding protein